MDVGGRVTGRFGILKQDGNCLFITPQRTQNGDTLYPVYMHFRLWLVFDISNQLQFTDV